MNLSDMKSLSGLKAINFFLVVVIMSNYFQMDLIKKNKWKEFELLGTYKPVWGFILMSYLFGDIVLFLIACQ